MGSTRPRPWFRCYLPPCDGAMRTDDTWAHHCQALHADQDGMARTRGHGTDVLPLPAVQGREAFLAERARRRG